MRTVKLLKMAVREGTHFSHLPKATLDAILLISPSKDSPFSCCCSQATGTFAFGLVGVQRNAEALAPYHYYPNILTVLDSADGDGAFQGFAPKSA